MTMRLCKQPSRPWRLAVVATALVATAASCTVGPNYRRPTQAIPATYAGPASAPSATHPAIGRDWWTLFNSQTLDSLEDEAIAANPNLIAAAARVREARAAVGVSRSDFFPAISFGPGITRQRSGNTRISTGTISSGSTGTGSGTGTGTGTGSGSGSSNGSGNTGGTGSNTVSGTTITGGRTTTAVRIPFDLSYEVDVWGRVRREVESADALLHASAADYEVVLQTLEADVAQDFVTIRSLVDQERILERTVQSYRSQLDLVQSQQTAGIVGQADVSQVQALLYSTITQQVEVQRQRADLEHALAILLGRAPGDLALEAEPLDAPPPTIPVGLPSELLRRRPDVVEAEQNLRSANAQVGVATALFYPQLDLSGLAGFESLDVRHALDWQNRVWSVGASATVPLFEGGRLTANLEQQRARYDELAATYRTTVLGAIRDVEDSLADLHFRAQEANAQADAVRASSEYVRLSDLQFRQGLISYLQVIDADRTLLSNQLSAAQILNQRMVSTILLIKALGGGWEDPATTAPSRP